jgi:signal peptidase I
LYYRSSEAPTDSSIAPSALPRPRLARWGSLREIVDLIALILAIYALVNLSSVRYIVDGPSMQPNFATGQFLIVSRLNYLLGKPEHGDIVVFHAPPNPEQDYIKRVIGVPGEHVHITDGKVYVNDQPLTEPYINEQNFRAACSKYCDVTLGADEYFLMGDNRNHSSDSRDFGPVKWQNIVGEALIRYWPPDKWGLVTKIAYP